jgi:eukaryotic-like serine/threonine-protein kinase
MSYCPECGEKIANDDIFCPFCGISIKPIAPVEDASMSETIVDMPPVVINKEALDALTAKSGAATPKTETHNPPPAEKQESSESLSKAENSEGFSAGDTAENWAMKTESVEIPAANLEEIKSIPLPSPFGDDEPVPAKDSARPVHVTPPTPFETEEPQTPPAAESGELENITDAPTPAIIQEENLEAKPFNPFEETPVNEIPLKVDAPKETLQADVAESEINESESSASAASEPTGEPFELSGNRAESPAVEETFEPLAAPLEDKVEDFDNVPTEIPSAFAESNLKTEASEPVSEEPQADEASAPVVETPAEIIEPAEVSKPPIVMPELPLVLENQEEMSRFDSVKIIQRDEIEDEKARAAEAESKTTGEQTPADENQVAAKAAHSSTTPIVGNTDTDGRKAAKLKPLDEGTILNGRYEIVRKIGGGGMGAVYLANDRNLGGVLRAVKEMVQSYIESEQQDKAVSDFKRESLLLTSLDHTAIPTIYDYFFDEKEGRFYLVMKYISGGDLASRLRAAPEGRLDEKTVTEWAIQIADVLHYLHNHEPSIVYRDLKPANVMIDGNSGRVMLIDFGIARWVNKEEKGVTAVGTMGYAPPELFSGNVEPRSDIYSLGSTMFHLLTGADPQSNPLLIFDFQKNPRPRQINSQLSDQIEQILLRSVEYSAEARFTSAAEMRDALKEHLQNLQMGKVTFGVKVAPSNRAFSEQAVFCGFCGKQIVATDVFCAFCGAQQPIAQQGVSHPSIAVQPMTAKLVIQGTGELEPSSFRLEKSDNLLGRRDPMSNIFPEVDLSKYDPQTKISRRHARIWREGNSFLVEDLGSSNGTTLLPSASDSVRLLPHQPHTLTNGDKIKLGDTTLHFTIG